MLLNLQTETFEGCDSAEIRCFNGQNRTRFPDFKTFRVALALLVLTVAHTPQLDRYKAHARVALAAPAWAGIETVTRF